MLTSILFALAGGALIGSAIALLLVFDGRVAGISGVVGGLVSPVRGEWSWRAMFVAGLLAGAVVMRIVRPESFGVIAGSFPTLVLAGALVGFGTRLSNGCTSGHGVCGNSRLAPRSIVATMTFMAVAGGVVFLLHRGGSS